MRSFQLATFKYCSAGHLWRVIHDCVRGGVALEWNEIGVAATSPTTWHSEICVLFKGPVECGTNPLSFIGLGALPIGQAWEPGACAGAYRISHGGQKQRNILFESNRRSHSDFDMPSPCALASFLFVRLCVPVWNLDCVQPCPVQFLCAFFYFFCCQI